MSDFEQFKLPDGSVVGTGLLMPTVEEQKLTAAMPMFPQNWVLDPKDIQRALLATGGAHRYIHERTTRRKRIRNQASLGKCNASSNASGAEQCREIQKMPHVPLSDCFTYIQVNGGRDQGSGLPSTFKNLQDVGVAPYMLQVGGMTKQFPNNAFNKSQVDPAVYRQAQIEAARFKGLKYFKLPTDNFQDFVIVAASAIARKLPIVWAWHVGANGSRLKNGYMQAETGARAPGNHSNLIHSGKWMGGKNLVDPDNQNSWGPVEDEIYGPKGASWGEGGFALTTMEILFACAHIHPPYVQVASTADINDPAFAFSLAV
jgi:hypothetical protein